MHGVVDVDGVDISDKELMSHAFVNAVSSLGNCDPPNDDERYVYQRGSRFVNEYARKRADGTFYEGTTDDPSHLLGCFPTLFPYGKGGFEVDRPVKISYESHIKWALSYCDRRWVFLTFFSFVNPDINI